MVSNADASLLQFLPSKHGLGVTCTILICLLVNAQNELLEVCASHYGGTCVRRGVWTATASDLVAYDPHKDLLALVQQYCNYSLEVCLYYQYMYMLLKVLLSGCGMALGKP